MRLTPSGIDEARGSKVELIIPDTISHHLQACAGLQTLLQTVPPLVPALRHPRGPARGRASASPESRQRYPTVMPICCSGWTRRCTGRAGRRCASAIVAQYPAVLIDEFQDTSPLQ